MSSTALQGSLKSTIQEKLFSIYQEAEMSPEEGEYITKLNGINPVVAAALRYYKCENREEWAICVKELLMLLRRAEGLMSKDKKLPFDCLIEGCSFNSQSPEMASSIEDGCILITEENVNSIFTKFAVFCQNPQLLQKMCNYFSIIYLDDDACKCAWALNQIGVGYLIKGEKENALTFFDASSRSYAKNVWLDRWEDQVVGVLKNCIFCAQTEEQKNCYKAFLDEIEILRDSSSFDRNDGVEFSATRPFYV